MVQLCHARFYFDLAYVRRGGMVDLHQSIRSMALIGRRRAPVRGLDASRLALSAWILTLTSDDWHCMAVGMRWCSGLRPDPQHYHYGF